MLNLKQVVTSMFYEGYPPPLLLVVAQLFPLINKHHPTSIANGAVILISHMVALRVPHKLGLQIEITHITHLRPLAYQTYMQ